MEICKQQSKIKKGTKRETEICKQQSEIKNKMEICKQQSEIEMNRLPAVDRFKHNER